MPKTPQTNGQRKLRYIELFAGIGGFGLALNRQGHTCVYANEWDKYAAQTYEKNFGHKPDTNDIKDIESNNIPDHDLLLGGFPCQSFSVAGKRGGFNDTRGTLFFEIARILKDKRPTYLLLENVKGLLSHDNGRTFQTIMRTLDELGYDLQWQVLNSKNFGVPQNRERVFIIGHLRGESRPKIFPIRKDDEIPSKRQRQISPTITQRYYKQGQSDRYIAVEKPVAIPVLTPDRIKKRQNGRRFKKDGEPSFTLTGQDKHGIMINDMKIRRLTPLECERLQGFPDGWTEGVSDTQRYKQLGNAVTVNVVEEIVKRL